MLFLGNEQSAKHVRFDLVVNATRNVDLYGPERLSVSHRDDWPYFVPLYHKVVRQYLSKNRRVLIHCRSGRHRAAALAAAFVSHMLNISPDDAMWHVKDVRGQVELEDDRLKEFVYWASRQTV